MGRRNQILHTTRCRHTQLVHICGIILLVLCKLLKRTSRTCRQLGSRAIKLVKKEGQILHFRRWYLSEDQSWLTVCFSYYSAVVRRGASRTVTKLQNSTSCQWASCLHLNFAGDYIVQKYIWCWLIFRRNTQFLMGLIFRAETNGYFVNEYWYFKWK